MQTHEVMEVIERAITSYVNPLLGAKQLERSNKVINEEEMGTILERSYFFAELDITRTAKRVYEGKDGRIHLVWYDKMIDEIGDRRDAIFAVETIMEQLDNRDQVSDLALTCEGYNQSKVGAWLRTELVIFVEGY